MALAQNDLVRSFTPPSWAPMSGEIKLHKLPESSEEYKTVVREVNNSLKVQVDSVVQVQNPFLWGCYQYKKLEYYARGYPVTEKKLFHCTAADNIDSIARDNLDWRLCSRSLFGQGVSFSPRAEYANKYANYNIGSDRALILSDVLVGRETQGRKSMIIPPTLFDTTIGNNEMVYVKYYDYEFYPTHVAYYTCSTNPRAKSHHSFDDYVSSDSDYDYYDDHISSRDVDFWYDSD